MTRAILGQMWSHLWQNLWNDVSTQFDGYRMLCRIDRGRVTVSSRNGEDWTDKLQNVVEAVKSLKDDDAQFSTAK